MSLSNLDKDVSTRLFKMLSLNDDNQIDTIKNNYSGYGQLMLLAEQIANLQLKAKEIINNISINDHLHSLDVLNKCYSDPATSEGDKRFYWAKIQQLTNTLTDTK